MPITLPWQKTFRKLPPLARAKLSEANELGWIVSVSKVIPHRDIDNEIYKHLSIGIKNGKVEFNDVIVPSANVGKASRLNVNGKQIIRRDLPKVPKTFTFEAPNFGDFSKGTHDVSFTKDCYQRELKHPKYNSISIKQLDADEENTTFLFKVEEVLDANSSSFEESLLANINLLQENTGTFDLFPENATDIDYLQSIIVKWEILPPGTDDNVNLRKIIGRRRSGVDEPEVRRRYEFIKNLNPRNFISGTSGFQRYFGAQFEDNLVVFENIAYGNALYVMFNNWQILSQRSRIDLIKSEAGGYVRIVHRAGWEKSLARVINQYRAEKGI